MPGQQIMTVVVQAWIIIYFLIFEWMIRLSTVPRTHHQGLLAVKLYILVVLPVKSLMSGPWNRGATILSFFFHLWTRFTGK